MTGGLAIGHSPDHKHTRVLQECTLEFVKLVLVNQRQDKKAMMLPQLHSSLRHNFLSQGRASNII